MALVPCFECNQSISDKATICPHCGINLLEHAPPVAPVAPVSAAPAMSVPPEPSQTTCPACHQNVPEHVVYCPFCQAKVDVSGPVMVSSASHKGFNVKNKPKKNEKDITPLVFVGIVILFAMMIKPGMMAVGMFTIVAYCLVYLFHKGFAERMDTLPWNKVKSTRPAMIKLAVTSGCLFLVSLFIGNFQTTMQRESQAAFERDAQAAKQQAEEQKRLLTFAYDAYQKKDFVKSINYYEKAKASLPLEGAHLTNYNTMLANSRVKQGNQLYAKGLYSQAKTRYQEAVALNPKLSDAQARIKQIEAIEKGLNKQTAWNEYLKARGLIYASDESTLNQARTLLTASLAKYEYAEARQALTQVDGKLSKIAERSRAQLDIKAFRWGRTASDSYVEATGQVQNLTSGALENIQAVVSFYDSQENFITSDDALIEYKTLLPGQASPFKVIARANPEMRSATIEFKILMGEKLETYESYR